MGIQMNLDCQQTRLAIEGDIYREDAEVLQAIIGDRVRSGSHIIYLDMAGVYYIDCKSVVLLAKLRKNLKDKGITMVFGQAREWSERLKECSSCQQNYSNQCKSVFM